MSLTNTFETRVLQWVLNSGNPTRPSMIRMALFTAAPGEAGGGTEVSGGGYARQPVTFNVAGDEATNAANVEFPVATANWGNITHGAVFDAQTGGNMIAYGPLPNPRNIQTGDIFRTPTGQFKVTAD